MSTGKYLSIGEVVRRTGLTERALRFYEQRGLLQPLRTDGGRRAYRAGDLMRINHIMLLRRARFSLSDIRRLLDSGDFDARSLVDLQIETLRAQRSMIDASLKALDAAREALSAHREIGLEDLCQMIRTGEQRMQQDAWQKIYDKYYTPEEQENWKAAKQRLGEEFDQDEYQAQWRDLAGRIEKALPIDPLSQRAQAFLREWNALLQPFMRVADEQMKAGANRLWSHMDEWSDQVQSPIPKQVWEFITAAARARQHDEQASG